MPGWGCSLFTVDYKPNVSYEIGRRIEIRNADFGNKGSVCYEWSTPSKELSLYRNVWQKHTSKNLKNEVKSVLGRYGFKLQQICSGTTDNADIVKKSVVLLIEEAEKPLLKVQEPAKTSIIMIVRIRTKKPGRNWGGAWRWRHHTETSHFRAAEWRLWRWSYKSVLRHLQKYVQYFLIFSAPRNDFLCIFQHLSARFVYLF